jgi:hypothetical protein
VFENVLALTGQEIFLVLISFSAAGSIQSMTNSSDDFENRSCTVLQTTVPPRAPKHTLLYVNLEKFPKQFLCIINAEGLKSTSLDNECIQI